MRVIKKTIENDFVSKQCNNERFQNKRVNNWSQAKSIRNRPPAFNLYVLFLNYLSI